ncbi:ribonuclease III, partial [Candidatus Saccharibacteria bacterium]|nr:ribonuclease III [Candidatus Saccharibacteria bacterium]
MDKTPYIEFAKEKLGFEFNNIDLLITALTHRSYVNEHKPVVREHNERLEYLGDAVLELVSSDFLYRNFNEPEGVMTALRSALVRTESIGAAGHELGYEPLVRLSQGEKKGSERAHEVILADCFEAVIGAIYLDHGYEAAKDFIYKHIIVKIDEIIEEGTWRDPKSYAQELMQKFDGMTPVYHTLS